MAAKKWEAVWSAAGGWNVYLGSTSGAADAFMAPLREADAKLAARAPALRATLEGHAVRLIGPRSPYWRCSYCQAMQTSPISFPHKPDCLLHYAPADGGER